jgi:hypothetical protein
MALPSSLGRLPSYSNAPGAGGFEKLQNSPFGSGSLTAGLSQGIQSAGGLGNMRGTPVGRSTMDPGRALGMLSRGTARPGQVEAAMGLANLQRQQTQDARQGRLFDMQMEQANALTEAYKRMGLMGGDGPTTGQMPAQASQPMAEAMGGGSLLNVPDAQEKNSMLGSDPNLGGGMGNSIAGSMGGNSLYNFGRPF